MNIDKIQRYGTERNELKTQAKCHLEELYKINRELSIYRNIPEPGEFIDVTRKQKKGQHPWLEHYEGIPTTFGANVNTYPTGVPILEYLATTHNQITGVIPKEFDLIDVFDKSKKLYNTKSGDRTDLFESNRKRAISDTISAYKECCVSFLTNCESAISLFEEDGFQESGMITEICRTINDNIEIHWEDIPDSPRNEVGVYLNIISISYDDVKYALLENLGTLHELDRTLMDQLHDFFIGQAEEKTSNRDELKKTLKGYLTNYQSLTAEMDKDIQNMQTYLEELEAKKRTISEVLEVYKESYITKKTEYLRDDIRSLENNTSGALLPDNLLDNISKILRVESFSNYTPDDFINVDTDFNMKYIGYRGQKVYDILLKLRNKTIHKTLEDCDNLDENIEIAKIRNILELKEMNEREGVKHWSLPMSEFVAGNNIELLTEIEDRFDEQKEIVEDKTQVSEALRRLNGIYANLSSDFKKLKNSQDNID